MLTAFFIVFSVTRFESTLTYEAYTLGSQPLSQAAGLTNTLMLITSSFRVALSLKHFRKNNLATAIRYIARPLSLGCIFIALKICKYIEKLAQGISLSANPFYEFYFVSIGLHLMHVVIVVGLLSFLLLRMTGVLRKQTEQHMLYQATRSSKMACY